MSSSRSSPNKASQESVRPLGNRRWSPGLLTDLQWILPAEVRDFLWDAGGSIWIVKDYHEIIRGQTKGKAREGSG